MNTTLPIVSRATDGAAVIGMVLLQGGIQVRPAALSKQIGVVCWRADGDSPRTAREVVAQIHREALKLISAEADVVLDD